MTTGQGTKGARSANGVFIQTPDASAFAHVSAPPATVPIQFVATLMPAPVNWIQCDFTAVFQCVLRPGGEIDGRVRLVQTAATVAAYDALAAQVGEQRKNLTAPYGEPGFEEPDYQRIKHLRAEDTNFGPVLQQVGSSSPSDHLQDGLNPTHCAPNLCWERLVQAGTGQPFQCGYLNSDAPDEDHALWFIDIINAGGASYAVNAWGGNPDDGAAIVDGSLVTAMRNSTSPLTLPAPP